MSVKAADVYDCLESLAPFALQEEWDNSGVQVGDVDQATDGVLVALDVTAGAVQAAVAAGARLIISHHPLIFRPLRKVDRSREPLAGLLRHDITVISSHTPLDVVAGGVSFALAAAIGVEKPSFLVPLDAGAYHKLVFFAPAGHEKKMLDGLFGRGIGEYGMYDGCAFMSPGAGVFRPKKGSRPYVSSRRPARESRVELLVRRDRLSAAIDRLRQLHPYEEPAFDVFPEAANPVPLGYGCIGLLKKAARLAHVADDIRNALGLGTVRFTGDPNKKVKTVALCGGSGGGFVGQAARAGADLYVSGDLKYHDVLEGAGSMATIDIGHRASELPVLGVIENLIKKRFKRLPVHVYTENRDFFTYLHGAVPPER